LTRLIAFLLRHRLANALLIVASVAASLYAARSLEVRFQYRDFYEYAGNPRLPLMTRYSQEFGDPGGAVVVLVDSPNVFTNDVLQYVDQLTRQLEGLEQFARIRSLTNARVVRAAGNDDVETGPLLRKLPASEEALQHARETALRSSLLPRRLIAPDGTATAILAEMRVPSALASIPEQKAAIEAIERALKGTPAPVGTNVQVTGAPLVETEVTNALISDQAVLTPCVFAILVLALALTFRSIHGIILPLSAVLVSMAWTAGVFSFFGHPIDIIGSVIPTTLLVYGVVDPIFVYTRFVDKLALFGSRERAILEAMRELWMPCFLTSLTTALGFAAFITATLPTIKYFGVAVALGVMFSFVTTVTVLPLLLVSVAPSRHRMRKPWISQATDALMERLWETVQSNRGLIFAAAVVLLAVGAVSVRHLRINAEYVGGLPQGRARESIRELEDKLSGVVRLTIYLEGAPDSMKRPEVLQAIEAVDRFSEKQPAVTSSLSLADLVSDTNQAFSGGSPSDEHVPNSPALISQYLSMVDPGDLSDFVTSDYSRSPIQILLADHGSAAVRQIRDVLQREIDARFPKLGIRATLTGHGLVAYYDCDRAIDQMVWGFLAAFIAITGIQMIAFRSIRLAFLSVVPNLVPICACVIVMRLLGLELGLDTSLVMCISIGALFNTTIHIVARIQQQLRAAESEPDLIVGQALKAVGPASLYTAVILSLGFATMELSRFPGLQTLGLLCMVTMLTAFIADALLTTSLLRSFFDWSPSVAGNLGTDLAMLSIGNREATK
jgi:predicted RND superfamily exporter protein